MATMPHVKLSQGSTIRSVTVSSLLIFIGWLWSKTLYSHKVLVIPRKQWFHPDMTEKLLTGTLSLNTNKQNHWLVHVSKVL